MKINLSKREKEAVRDRSLYPGCFWNFKDYAYFFDWSKTRQGHSYWKGKAESEKWSQYSIPSIVNSPIRKNLTDSDKMYLSLLAFSCKHNILVFEFSNESQAPGL